MPGETWGNPFVANYDRNKTSLEFITMATGDDKQPLGRCRTEQRTKKRRHTLLTEHGKISPGEGESSVCRCAVSAAKERKRKGEGEGEGSKGSFSHH